MVNYIFNCYNSLLSFMYIYAEKMSRALKELVKKECNAVLYKTIKALIIRIIYIHTIVYDHWLIIYYIT